MCSDKFVVFSRYTGTLVGYAIAMLLLIQNGQHTTLEPRNHRSITSTVIDWGRLCPTITPNSIDYLTYIHGLVSTLPLANSSRAAMSVIDHIYIGILPQSTHATI